MCGIWALLKTNVELSKLILDSIMMVSNRGPDSTNIHIENNYITCFHRLAINDLSVCGNQPFYYSTENYNYILMCNGEIYNHKILEEEFNIKTSSSSDCAVLLSLFIKLNEDFYTFNNLLRGEYAIIILKQNKKNNQIDYFASVDPLSVRPLFYYRNNEEIGISSILGGLSKLSNDVIRLNQGYYIIGNNYNRNFIMKRYHELITSILDINKEQLYREIVNTLIESVKLRLESDRPLGCLLSGGLDSSLIAAIASLELKKKNQKLRTFSIGMEDGTDLKYAKMVAKHINSEHTVFYFDQQQGLEAIEEVIKATETYDITTIRASVGQYLIAKNIREKTDVKVVLNGDGADECQMGYLYFYLHPNLEEARKDRDKLLEQIHCFDGLRVDRNISYHGLEARVPFLDKEFVDLYYQIPTELLVPTKDNMEKYLIRKAFEVVMPDLLPKEVLWRKKEAFSDGVSSKEKSWYLIVKEHYSEKITENEFNKEFEGIQPLCKESYYYRQKFNELYGNNQRVIPRYWLPNWTETKDPSARTLKVYDK